MRLEGKRVLITGGGTGIGAGIARQFVAEGAKVTVAGRRESHLTALCGEIGCNHVVGDVSVRDDAERMVAETVSVHGGLDILVNNAGMARFLPLSDTTDELIDQHLNVNVKGPLYLARAAVAHLKEMPGCIVNISSTLAVKGISGAAVYGATKGALNAMTLHLAAELAPDGIRVNCVCPAVVETPIFETMMPREAVAQALEELKAIHPLGRIGQPDDVAQAVTYLASDEASWVTGAILNVDGGATAV